IVCHRSHDLAVTSLVQSSATYRLVHPTYRTCFFFYYSGHHPHLHSFPTRRSSDLPSSRPRTRPEACRSTTRRGRGSTCRSCPTRSEEHTSELQSRFDLVCRLLLEKKKQSIRPPPRIY